MPRLPVVKPVKLIKILQKLNYQEIRQKGSHKFFYNFKEHRSTVVPFHAKEIGKGLLKAILHDINLSVDDLIKLLKK